MTELLLTDEEEARYREQRSLSTDEDGKKILVGLTVEESIWLVEHNRGDIAYRTGSSTERPTEEDKRRARELRDKHEIVRLAMLGFRNHVLRTDRT
ncbi:MAG: hypothetical protein EOQ28_03030 [Mesorhizobium sp.]|uniref:hypothetical protein n=1 Tax=Mesorhizobium sp. TaxID=1871066 RepID=UPI000FE6C06C|nr:hypothetical protein [Mesorhizobium sp.]RWA76674.1 MAG: hypothetical protein EOQ28_03030 [Mesorhizobium sp.]RWC05066.1 MAG: hypothetical protein EOQ57_05640 [Mesorhizobium sp.]